MVITRDPDRKQEKRKRGKKCRGKEVKTQVSEYFKSRREKLKAETSCAFVHTERHANHYITFLYYYKEDRNTKDPIFFKRRTGHVSLHSKSFS